jgi:hypothetical protein
MSTVTIAPGEQVEKDPSDCTVWEFSWDEHLADGVTLVDEGILTITCVSDPTESPIELEYDNLNTVTGNRKVTFRLLEGKDGSVYNVAHSIETAEAIPQCRERSFFVWVHQL